MTCSFSIPPPCKKWQVWAQYRGEEGNGTGERQRMWSQCKFAFMPVSVKTSWGPWSSLSLRIFLQIFHSKLGNIISAAKKPTQLREHLGLCSSTLSYEYSLQLTPCLP